MSREAIIQKTVKAINMLPSEKIVEVSDFTEYLLKKHEEYILQKGIEKLTVESQAFQFLNDEEDIYTEDDIIERY